jgi:hypothetical protein
VNDVHDGIERKAVSLRFSQQPVRSGIQVDCNHNAKVIAHGPPILK